jgi:hypothetical protein
VSVLRARLQRAAFEDERDERRGGAKFDVAAALEQALGAGPRVSGARWVPLDHQRARAIPIIGPMAGGGAIPGTRQDRNRRLDSWSGRG